MFFTILGISLLTCYATWLATRHHQRHFPLSIIAVLAATVIVLTLCGYYETMRLDTECRIIYDQLSRLESASGIIVLPMPVDSIPAILNWEVVVY